MKKIIIALCLLGLGSTSYADGIAPDMNCKGQAVTALAKKLQVSESEIDVHGSAKLGDGAVAFETFVLTSRSKKNAFYKVDFNTGGSADTCNNEASDAEIRKYME